MAEILFLMFVLLKQFYLFPSGRVGVADICLIASFLVLLFDCIRKKKKIFDFREDGLFYAFLIFVVVINAYYGTRLGNRGFLKYTIFWIYNGCGIWTFGKLLLNRNRDDNIHLLKWINHIAKFNIVLQMIVYLSGHGRIFYEYWGAERYQGTFNDPNQLSFFLFMMVLLLYLYRCEFGDRSFPFFYLLALPVIVASKSTGTLLGLMVFTFAVVFYALYGAVRRKNVSRKVWITGVVSGFFLFCLLLWWIWPTADFDVKTMDYNMLTRIQEKIWKVSHGGLLGLILDRGMEKLVLYPHYMLYGAGEGDFERFTLASQINEIHCCLFSVLFCYGIVPTVCLLGWLVRKLRFMNAAMMCAVAGLLAESFFLVNYRQPMFWMILLYGSVSYCTGAGTSGTESMGM